MKKLISIATALSLATTLGLAGCKKKDKDEGGGTAAKPSGEQPGGEKPGGDKPGGDKPGGDQPGGDKPGGGGDTAQGGGDGTGVPECDEYMAMVEKLSGCDKMGPAADSMKQAADAMKQSWAGWNDLDDASKKAAQEAAGPSCKQATDALKQSAQAMGCEL